MKYITIRRNIIIFLILFAISGCSQKIEENTFLNEYETDTYIGYLEIPKIKLKKGFFNENHPLNDVNKNILFINPNIKNTFVFAAHSGIGKLAYFNDLKNIVIGDDIFVEIKEENYHYKVTNIKNEIKGKNIKIDNKENMLILTTCNQVLKGYQLIIEAYLVEE